MLVKDIYNKVAIITGFPVYSNETDTPETTRFLLEQINEALQSTIDSCYLSNNVLERTDTIVTSKHKDEYGIAGIIKNAQIFDKKKNKRQTLVYNDRVNPYDEVEHREVESGKLTNTGFPNSYTIKRGYMKLYPMPDDVYTIKLTLSTQDLILSDNDTYKYAVDNINDRIYADDRFCELVILKAATLIFARCQNANTQYYAELLDGRMKTYQEFDLKTMDSFRAYEREGGNFRLDKGLLG